MHPLPDVAAGALQNRDVRSFVRDMRARFALTIIAAPPLRAGSGTLLFARWADRVLLGIRLGRVAEDEDHVLPVELRHLGARVAGIVPVSPTTIARMPCNPISTST
jgi:Mrp family chromosome partitioning ATPase